MTAVVCTRILKYNRHPINRGRIIRLADYPRALFRELNGVSKDKLNVKWLFKKEQVQNEGSLFRV
jgi:hypothetical protein